MECSGPGCHGANLRRSSAEPSSESKAKKADKPKADSEPPEELGSHNDKPASKAKRGKESTQTGTPAQESPKSAKGVAQDMPAADEAPAANSPVADEPPAAKTPVVDKPVAKRPVAEKPEVKAPVADKPEMKAPVADKPEMKAPVADKPEAKAPVADKPAAKTPAVADEPIVTGTPVTDEAPAAKSPVADEAKKESRNRALTEPVPEIVPASALPETAPETGVSAATQEMVTNIPLIESARLSSDTNLIDSPAEATSTLSLVVEEPAPVAQVEAAAVAASAVNQCNGTDNVGGLAVECDVTVTNRLDLATGEDSSV